MCIHKEHYTHVHAQCNATQRTLGSFGDVVDFLQHAEKVLMRLDPFVVLNLMLI